ncbi:MAG: Uncharacterised protein [Cellulomonadaceae bacterium TMED98]|nr:MAG: Uncharacterised protein [Cellulomonadaceae bacterium TMED98]
MDNNNHGPTAGGQLPDQTHHPVLMVQVERGRGLVQQDNLCVLSKHPG